MAGMKRMMAMALAVLMALAGAGMAEGPRAELIVFAAASMTETLEQAAELYREVAPNVDVVFNFDSSGTLKTQIEEGAACDVFISAAQKQMNELDELEFVAKQSRVDLLENKVALVVPEGNPKGVADFDDMAEKLAAGGMLLAMGNADVPVGQYTLLILDYYELDEQKLAAAGSVTYGSNVKEVTTQVSEQSVDCGIIYQTDAYSAGLAVVDTATPEMCGQVIYPAAVLNTSRDADAAQAFLDFLRTPECAQIFEGVGFTAIG